MTNTKRPRDLEADEVATFDAVQQQMQRVAERIGACPAPDRLLDAHAGRLPEALAPTVLAHLSSCPMCQALIEALVECDGGDLRPAERHRIDARVVRATSARLARRRILPFPRDWRWRAVAAGAAAAVLVVLVTPSTSIDPTALPAVRLPAAAQRVRPPSLTILRAERLSTSDMGLAAVAWRGDAEGVPPASAFDAARAAFDDGEFAEAERRLREITVGTPALAAAWLLLGVSRLLLGQAAEAVAPLEVAYATLVGGARQDAAWHLAVALHATGRDVDARALLTPLCHGLSARGPMACLALDELRGP
jgi:hypothetical protein